MARHNPSKLPFVIAISLIAIASALFWRMDVDLLYAYLLSVSVTTFLFYGYDKRQSLKNGWRVPEAVLHILALSGGTPGAFLGQIVFRHKTRKLRFKAVFVVIVLLQALVGLFCWQYWTRGTRSSISFDHSPVHEKNRPLGDAPISTAGPRTAII